MDDFDLEIENYDLREILNLFKIDYNFDSIDLKRAQRTALKMHPDKSNLPKEYFMFFRKAFQIVQQIYYYRNKKLQDSKNKEYTVDVNKENKKLRLWVVNFYLLNVRNKLIHLFGAIHMKLGDSFELFLYWPFGQYFPLTHGLNFLIVNFGALIVPLALQLF